MSEVYSAMQACLLLLILAVSVFVLLLLALVFCWLKETVDKLAAMPIPVVKTLANAASIVSARKVEAAEKAEKPEKIKPGRSCGHCGTRIKNEPVKGLILEEQSYLVFECPACKKQTLLVQEPPH